MSAPNIQQGRTNTQELSPYAVKPWLKNYDFWVPENINYSEQSVYQILGLASSMHADKKATAFLGAELTYGDIKRQADKLAVALDQLGITKGDRVGIMLPNCPQYLIAAFGI